MFRKGEIKYIVNLPDINTLRSKINQKESFNNKPLITGKRGEMGTIMKCN